jgi:molybdate transport repressor ModE-like protein
MADQFRTGLDWEDVRVFIALARHGSLSAASRALSVNHATVSRRIASLEEALGAKLVERRPNGYVLTPTGTRALSSAYDMETAAAVLGRGGDDDTPKGLVRVNAPPSLTHSFLVAHLARLAGANPGLDIEAAADLRPASLERHETDIALRFGHPEDGDFIARKLLTLQYGFYASDQWRNRLERGESPVFVGFDEGSAYIPDAAWLTRSFASARVAFRASTQSAQAIAAVAGAGIALLPHFIGRLEAALHPCLADQAPPPRELWMITRRQDRKDLAIRTVTDFLVQTFSQEHELFE